MPINLLPEITEGTTLGSAIAGLLGLLIYLRKKLSRDRVDIQSNVAQVDLIGTLQKERDSARLGEELARKREDEAWKLRNADALLIGGLTAKVQTFADSNAMLVTQVAEQKETISQLTSKVQALSEDLHSALRFLESTHATLNPTP